MNDHQDDTAPQAEDNAAILNSVSPQQIAEAIKTAGCAVTLSEQGDVVLLHSASHGIGFQVLWGNVGAPGQYADFTLSCPLRVQGGALPDAILHEWHRSKRFARVAQHGDFVVLEMDVVAAGGVSAPHLAVMLQIWIQMMGQFFLHLRNYPGEAQPAADPVAETVAETAVAD